MAFHEDDTSDPPQSARSRKENLKREESARPTLSAVAMSRFANVGPSVNSRALTNPTPYGPAIQSFGATPPRAWRSRIFPQWFFPIGIALNCRINFIRSLAKCPIVQKPDPVHWATRNSDQIHSFCTPGTIDCVAWRPRALTARCFGNRIPLFRVTHRLPLGC